ncbi:MAG: hypothetical protein ACK559_20365, partial [bacterium]
GGVGQLRAAAVAGVGHGHQPRAPGRAVGEARGPRGPAGGIVHEHHPQAQLVSRHLRGRRCPPQRDRGDRGGAGLGHSPARGPQRRPPAGQVRGRRGVRSAQVGHQRVSCARRRGEGRG